jgi:Pyruvate/2-oxoacid:ferredoxin oxidoreductase delta subunit
MVRKYYPSLWSLWEELLTRWARRLNLPESWVRYSLWRWLNPLASGRRRVEIKCLGKGFRSDWVSEYERRLGISILSKELKVNHSKLVFNIVIPHESLINQLGLLGKLSVVKNGDLLELHSDDYVIKLSRNTLEVSIRNVLKVNALDLMSKVVKVIIRWLKCVRCGACSLWCPSKTIELVNGKPTINNTRCLSCGVCLEVCPVSEVLVSKVLIPIITGGLSHNTESITSRRTPKIITLSKSSRSYLIGRKDSTGYDTDLSIPDNFFSC